MPQYQDSILDFSRFSKHVTLAAFKPFESAEQALDNILQVRSQWLALPTFFFLLSLLLPVLFSG